MCRALLRTTDGDITKFVNQTMKPRDNAQKWRVFKNFARFAKNPFGYLYWKFMPLHNANRIRGVWVLMLINIYCTWVTWMMGKNMKENMIAHYYVRVGEVTATQDPPHSDTHFPADRKKNYVRYSNFHQKSREKRISMVHFNWWCRD